MTLQLVFHTHTPVPHLHLLAGMQSACQKQVYLQFDPSPESTDADVSDLHLASE